MQRNKSISIKQRIAAFEDKGITSSTVSSSSRNTSTDRMDRLSKTAASSVYTDSSYTRPSTDSSTSSRPQQYSSQPLTYLNYRSGDAPPPSQPMPIRVDTRAPSQPVPIPHTPVKAAPTPSAPAARLSSGTLLLVIPGSLDPAITTYVQRALRRASISEVAVLGSRSQESAIKQLKMDLYGIAGSMQRELGVYTYLQDDWSPSAVETAVQKLGESKQITNVICDLEDAGSMSTTNVLNLDTHDLERSWQRSVGLLHAVAKQTLGQDVARNGSFFLANSATDGSPVTSIHKTSVQALLDNLAQTYTSAGVVVGHAEHILVPEPEPVKANGGTQLAPTNGWNDNDAGFTPSESPTKLWALWSEMGGAD